MGGIIILIMSVVEKSVQSDPISTLQLVGAIVSAIGGTLAAINVVRSLNERRIYSRQIKSLFVQVLTYSLATNELLLDLLHVSDRTGKTYEVYSHELESMKRNLSLILSVDLSKVSSVYQNNIQGYIYQYGKYINCVEEYLIRLKKRSDYNKEIFKGNIEGKAIRVNSENFRSVDGQQPEEIVNELLDSEYKIDYLIVESNSKIQKSFVQLLIDLRIVLQEMLQSTKKGRRSEQTDIQSVYSKFLVKNQDYEKTVDN